MRAEGKTFSGPFINETSTVAKKKKKKYYAKTKVLQRLQLHKQINAVYQQRYLLTGSQDMLVYNKTVAF